MKLLTSETHPIYVDWLPSSPGKVGMTIAPGKNAFRAVQGVWSRDLLTDLKRLVDVYETHVLVCLLEDFELEMMGIQNLVKEAENLGIEVHRQPICDNDVPRSMSDVRQLVELMTDRVRSGKNVVTHCRGGLGRAGTIVGCYLVFNGMSPDEAIDALHTYRNPNSPQTPEQEQFICDFASTVIDDGW